MGQHMREVQSTKKFRRMVHTCPHLFNVMRASNAEVQGSMTQFNGTLRPLIWEDIVAVSREGSQESIQRKRAPIFVGEDYLGSEIARSALSNVYATLALAG